MFKDADALEKQTALILIDKPDPTTILVYRIMKQFKVFLKEHITYKTIEVVNVAHQDLAVLLFLNQILTTK